MIFQVQQKVFKNENAQSKRVECKPQQHKAFAIHEDIPKEKKKTAEVKPKAVKIAECDQKQSTSTVNETKSSTLIVAESKSTIIIHKEQKITTEVKNDEDSKQSQDTEISANISHLHIPDPEDTLDVPCKSDLDMSIDSLCGSPMSVDRSIAIRRQEYQLALDQFYNVEEYDSEIYSYIKEAEVSITALSCTLCKLQ